MDFKKQMFPVVFLSIISSFCHAETSTNLIGHHAPQFTGQAVYPDGTVGMFNSKDFEGEKLVIAFYPMDNTPGCNQQARSFRDAIKAFEDQGIKVIVISCDSPESHLKALRKLHLPFILVSDSRWHRDISRAFGAAGFLYSKRKIFLVDEKGIVFEVFDKVNTDEQITAILAAFARHSNRSMNTLASKAAQKSSQNNTKVSDKVSQADTKVAHAEKTTSERVSEAEERAANKISNATSKAPDKLSQAGQKVGEKVEQVGEKISSTLHNHARS
jgi:peroxiredoxin Q/BCP